MAQNDQTPNSEIQGEGNYDASRRFRKSEEAFAKDSGKVDKAAHEAEDALDGPEGADLERARVESAKGKPS